MAKRKRTPQTHCRRGHPLEGDNLNPTRLKRGKRECLSCVRAVRVVRSNPDLNNNGNENIQKISDDFYEEIIRKSEDVIDIEQDQETPDIETETDTKSSEESSPSLSHVGQIAGLIPVSVPGASEPVMALQKDGKILVAGRHISSALGIDWSTQHKKLSTQHWATVVLETTVGSDGRTRDMAMIDRETLTTWLTTLDPYRVNPELRPTLKAYQKEAAKALDAYFHEGGAINPRATDSQLDELSRTIDISRKQLDILDMARKMLPESHIEARAEIAVARAFGETPQIEAQSIPIYIQDFLKGKGMTRSDVESYDSSFGREVSRAYFKKYGKNPEKFPQATRDGAIRNINAYTEKDRPLMEQVWKVYQSERGFKNNKGEVLK